MYARFAVVMTLLLAITALSGCGGGGGGGTSPTPMGKATFEVQWPERTRLVPEASESVRIEITNGPASVDPKTLDRPEAGGTSTVTFENLPVGNYTATATAYPAKGATGTPQATGSAPLIVTAGQTATIALTMQSTVDRVEISPESPAVPLGGSAQLTATAKNAEGQVVLVSAGKIQWNSADTSVATVSAGGLVAGLAQGETNITVTETESGKSTTCQVTVTPPPGISGWVKDSLGNPVAGATVSAGGTTATTGATGSYSLALAVGTYDVTASANGYQQVTQPGVQVSAGAEQIQVNFNLPSATAVAAKVHGLDFSPYIDGQDPNTGSTVSEDQIRQRMSIIAPYTNWVRTFSSTGGLEHTGRIAHQMGLKVAASAWLGRDSAANEREISGLIGAMLAGHVDLAIVGSEALLRNDLSESQLIQYIGRVKQAAPSIPVATADVYGEILAHPNVVNAIDVVLVNYYPYWEGVKIDRAVATLHGWHQQVMAAAGAKKVIVSETGWPSAGDTKAEAVPSLANAAAYFLNFTSWAKANNVDYFYFAALDESWKASYEGPQGAYWGVWDKNGTMKPGMEAVFQGQTVPDNWSGTGLVGGPGTPKLEFTHVPAYGSTENLTGQALHIRPVECKVAVYIYVGGWWTKPTAAQPVVSLRVDGTWTCDITTGGSDQNATKIAAYLIPATYTPPLALGGGTLPAELDQNALAKAEVTRTP